MSFKTYGQIKRKVELDLDLEDEDFIQSEELQGYCNEAIKALESIVLKLGEDYFLDCETLALVSGTSEYDLPTDIFADKIRRIVYAEGSNIYPIKHLRFKNSFEMIAWEERFGNTGQDYRYLITNDATAGRKIKFYPTPNVTGPYATIWYLRNANQVTSESSTVDLPEFYGFIEQYMKVRCYEKEMNPKLPIATKMLDAERQNVIETLQNRFPDDDTEIEQDLSHYDEHI